MKKKIVILAATFLLTTSIVLAKSNDVKVPESVISEFSTNFSHPKDVEWEKIDNYYKATFKQHGSTIFAFYTDEAEFMGIAKNMRSDMLPVLLQKDIRKKYEGYWITDLFKFSIKDKTGYFITLENADHKIMFKIDENQNWQFYKNVNKS